MNLTISSPSFISEADENLFFQNIYNLPNFESVKGIGANLIIQFKQPLQVEEFETIEAICFRWQIQNTHSWQAIA